MRMLPHTELPSLKLQSAQSRTSHTGRQWGAKQVQSTLLLPIATSSTAAAVGMRGSGRRGRGTPLRSTRVHTLKGASPLGSNWVEEFVGSKFTCASCQHAIVMVRMLFTSRSDLITLRARSRHPAQWPYSKIRACERRSLEQQGPLGQPSEAFTQVWLGSRLHRSFEVRPYTRRLGTPQGSCRGHRELSVAPRMKL